MSDINVAPAVTGYMLVIDPVVGAADCDDDGHAAA